MTPAAPVSGPGPRRGLLPGLCLVLPLLLLGQLLTAAPAAAHAELVSSSPANGARLARPPAQVVLRFTEGVGLVDGGIRLLDDAGAPVTTPSPVVVGSTVQVPMPADLPDGRYLVSWRVVSDDGHPVAGALSFGVGVAAAPTTGTSGGGSFSLPIVLVKFGGYLGFVLLVGAVVVSAAVWSGARRHRRVQLLLRVGAVAAVLSTVAALLLQGPYAAGEPLTRLFDRTLLAETARSSFGVWIQLRLYLLLAITAFTWRRGTLEWAFNRGFAVVCLAAVAVSFSGTGHAAAGGIADRVVDSVHALAAGVWMGGLVVLTAAATGPIVHPDRAAWVRFSRLALAAVVLLVGTGAVNAVLRLQSVPDLWQSGYGRVLALKVVLAIAAVSGGALSRRTLRAGAQPVNTVRFEAVATATVLAITAALGTMAPPAAPPRSIHAAPNLSTGRRSGDALEPMKKPVTGPTCQSCSAGPVPSRLPLRSVISYRVWSVSLSAESPTIIA